MDCEDCNREQNDRWNTHQRNKGSDQESDASDNLSDDCDPNHKVRQRDTRRVKNAGERFWSFCPFRQAVRQESETNYQSKRNPCIGRQLRPDIAPSQYFRGESSHCFTSHAATLTPAYHTRRTV